MAGFANSRLLNRPSFCMAASGPGVTDLLTGIAHAWADCTPVIALGGAAAVATSGSGTLSRNRYLAGYAIDTRESEFSEGTGCRTAARSDSISMETPLVDDVVAAVDIQRFAGDKAGCVVRQEGGGDAHVAAQAIGQSRGLRTILSRRSRATFDNTRRKRHASCGSDRN
jgi:hypothetical protein